MSDVREDIGYVPREPKKRSAPKTDLEVLQSIPDRAFEGVETVEDPMCPWMVTLRKKSGLRVYLYGASESHALSMARSFVDLGGLEP